MGAGCPWAAPRSNDGGGTVIASAVSISRRWIAASVQFKADLSLPQASLSSSSRVTGQLAASNG